MTRHELRAALVRAVEGARELRDAAVLGAEGGVRLAAERPQGAGAEGLALGYLWDEMCLVRAGRAGTLDVLDDEIAHAERLLANPMAVTGR